MDMTEDHILDLLPRIRQRDVHELTGLMRESLEDWARSRARDPGVHYSVWHNGKVVACGGVLEGIVSGIGVGWAIAAEGWWRAYNDALNLWTMFVKHGGYRRLECKCYVDNEPANRFALKLGFMLEGCLRAYSLRGEDINQYGIVLGE